MFGDFGPKFWKAVAAAAASLPQANRTVQVAFFVMILPPLVLGVTAAVAAHVALLLLAVVATAVSTRKFANQKATLLDSGARVIGTVSRNAAASIMTSLLLPTFSFTAVLVGASVLATLTSAPVLAAVFQRISSAAMKQAAPGKRAGSGRKGFKCTRHEVLEEGPHAARTARGCLIPCE